MSKRLDRDQAQYFVRPDLGPKYQQTTQGDKELTRRLIRVHSVCFRDIISLECFFEYMQQTEHAGNWTKQNINRLRVKNTMMINKLYR